RLFIVDRPGFGWTEVRDDLDGPFATTAESPVEQARLLAAATQTLGAENPLVVGHSFGAAVAMGWALEQPLSAAVVLSGATMPWPGEVDWTYRLLASRFGGAVVAPVVAAFLPESYVRDTLEGVFQPQTVPDDYFARAGVMQAVRTTTLRANARQVATLRPFVVKMALDYPRVTVPVEIIHGTADKTVFLEIHGEPLERTLPDANLTVIDGLGHMPHHWAIDDAIAAIDRAATRAGLR
ncbi:MAG: alpha/beta hydrolase, partial [Pseudomonadota bacterium]